MEQAAQVETIPAICAHIRSTRENLKTQWASDHPGERGNPYTQENVAHAMKLTRGAYGKYEKEREPSFARLRQIAVALDLPDYYFLPNQDLRVATSRVVAEADRFQRLSADFLELLGHLRVAAGLPVSGRDDDSP